MVRQGVFFENLYFIGTKSKKVTDRYNIFIDRKKLEIKWLMGVTLAVSG